jgi:hypothetical protein
LNESWNYGCNALLDRHLIPFDAPYEDWVYTGRWPEHDTYDYSYVRPDLIPPWMDGFDPLYDVASPPRYHGIGDQKFDERWYEWLFEPYGILWNDIDDILADVKLIAPEMHDLWYAETQSFGPYWDNAQITVPNWEVYDHFVAPEIRVLLPEDDEDTNYLFYVNRYLRTDSIPVEIVMDGEDFPMGTLGEEAIDHTRRCLVDPDVTTYGVLTCEDTLAAGEARLLELVTTTTIQADLRVTEPDVFCVPEGWVNRRRELRCTAGNDVNLGATFYNMGDSPTGNITVTFEDLSTDPPTTLGTDVINLPGMDDYYEPDSVSAVVEWETDSGDIGTHLVEISAGTIPGEYTPDNSVEVTVLVEPRDYATAVRGDPWDMTEADTLDWHTTDITEVSGDWDTSQSTGWTDSVSGMFEGALKYDFNADRYTGDISLAIPSNPSAYIDTDLYHILSIGMVGINGDLGDESCAVWVRWKDSQGSWHGWAETTLEAGNGRDAWEELGPIDLDDVSGLSWGGDAASDLELRFYHDGFGPSPPIDPHDTGIRIGWVKLEESAQ